MNIGIFTEWFKAFDLDITGKGNPKAPLLVNNPFCRRAWEIC